MTARVSILAAALALAGCAGRPAPVALIPPPAPPPPIANQAVAANPINARLSPAAALWHLRAGLNVAALACRGPGEDAIVTRYNALLTAHATALRDAEAAYAAEYRKEGGDWRDRYDDAQTRLYNFFGQARGRAGLCAAADEVFAALDGAEDAALAGMASGQLAALDRPFAPPRLEVDARALDGPAALMVASR